jgi:hypothetical protein
MTIILTLKHKHPLDHHIIHELLIQNTAFRESCKWQYRRKVLNFVFTVLLNDKTLIKSK